MPGTGPISIPVSQRQNPGLKLIPGPFIRSAAITLGTVQSAYGVRVFE
jgi:hypothetical protein